MPAYEISSRRAYDVVVVDRPLRDEDLAPMLTARLATEPRRLYTDDVVAAARRPLDDLDASHSVSEPDGAIVARFEVLALDDLLRQVADGHPLLAIHTDRPGRGVRIGDVDVSCARVDNEFSTMLVTSDVGPGVEIVMPLRKQAYYPAEFAAVAGASVEAMEGIERAYAGVGR